MQRLSRRTLLLYALPAVPLAALTLPLYIIVPTFYSEVLGLSLEAVGAALLLVRVVDAITDPAIGWAADRFRFRIGRRRAAFGVSLPIAGLGAFMLFWPPLGVTPVYLAGWGVVLSLGFTALLLSYQAWGAELAGGYRERSRVAGYRETFTVVGTLIAIALPFAIGVDHASGVHGLAVLGIAVVAGLAISGGLALTLVPEPKEFSTERLSIFGGLRHMAANRPFVRLIVAYFLNGLANGIPATLFLYFVSSVLGEPEQRGPMLFLYFLCGLGGVPFGVKLADRVGKHRAWCLAMIVNCLVFAAVALLGPGDVAAFAIISALSGICLGFDLALPSAIQADVIDVDTAASGEQRSGLYFAAWSLATKLSLAVGVGLVFPVLSWAGFDTSAGTGNSHFALATLVAVYVWVPIGLKLSAVALMWNFPLDEAEQSGIRAGIEARR